MSDSIKTWTSVTVAAIDDVTFCLFSQIIFWRFVWKCWKVFCSDLLCSLNSSIFVHRLLSSSVSTESWTHKRVRSSASVSSQFALVQSTTSGFLTIMLCSVHKKIVKSVFFSQLVSSGDTILETFCSLNVTLKKARKFHCETTW